MPVFTVGATPLSAAIPFGRKTTLVSKPPKRKYESLSGDSGNSAPANGQQTPEFLTCFVAEEMALRRLNASDLSTSRESTSQSGSCLNILDPPSSTWVMPPI